MDKRYVDVASFIAGILLIFYTGGSWAMKISSPAFAHNTLIPSKYTCDGNNISPPLVFNDIPANTKALALIVDDPDAPGGIWTHWMLYNLSPTIKSLPENITTYPSGTLIGKNSWQEMAYGGPCPPSDTHRYFFKLYALDEILPLTSGLTNDELVQKMSKHVITQAELVGLYQKQKVRK